MANFSVMTGFPHEIKAVTKFNMSSVGKCELK